MEETLRTELEGRKEEEVSVTSETQKEGRSDTHAAETDPMETAALEA